MFEIEETDSKRVRREKEIRKGILLFLMNTEGNLASVDELKNHLRVSRHTIDKHLAFLSGANLVDTKQNIYYITEEGSAQILPKESEKKEPQKKSYE